MEKQRNQSEPFLVVMKAGSDRCELLREAAGRGRRSSIEGISADAAGRSVFA